MTANRQFILGFTLPVLALFSALLLISLYLQMLPLATDLTRLGGYTTKDFGSQGGLEYFKKRHTDRAKGYTRPYDVLVLGDSFSRGGTGFFWQNYFFRSTGLSILTVQFYEMNSFEQVLTSPAFQAHPPRLVVLESAEFKLVDMFGKDPERPAPKAGRRAPAIRVLPAAVVPVAGQAPAPWNPAMIDFSLTRDYLKKNLPRWYLGHNQTPVTVGELTRGDLFTNRASNQFLILDQHLAKKDWTRRQIEQVGLYLLNLQARFESNGKTHFTVLVAPDRLTSYAPYLRDRHLAGVSKLAWLYNTPGLHAPRVDRGLAWAIARGERDVYLPGDTHWGPTGHRVAAQALIDQLVADQVLLR